MRASVPVCVVIPARNEAANTETQIESDLSVILTRRGAGSTVLGACVSRAAAGELDVPPARSVTLT